MFCLWYFHSDKISDNGKVFAKGGLNWTKSSISTNRSECFFHETKLLKKCEVEKQARLNAAGFSIIYSTPPFANTML